MHVFQVDTEIARSFQDFSLMKNGFRVMNVFGMLQTPEKGARTTINCAVNPELAGVSGVYYINCKPAQPSQLARQVILVQDQQKPWGPPPPIFLVVNILDYEHAITIMHRNRERIIFGIVLVKIYWSFKTLSKSSFKNRHLKNAKKRPLAHTGTLLTINHRIDSE